MINLLLKLKSLEAQIKRNPNQVPIHQLFDVIVLIVAKLNKFRTNAIQIPDDMLERIRRKDFSFIMPMLPEVSISFSGLKQMLCRSGFDKVSDNQIRAVFNMINSAIPNITLMET